MRCQVRTGTDSRGAFANNWTPRVEVVAGRGGRRKPGLGWVGVGWVGWGSTAQGAGVRTATRRAAATAARHPRRGTALGTGGGLVPGGFPGYGGCAAPRATPRVGKPPGVAVLANVLPQHHAGLGCTCTLACTTVSSEQFLHVVPHGAHLLRKCNKWFQKWPTASCFQHHHAHMLRNVRVSDGQRQLQGCAHRYEFN